MPSLYENLVAHYKLNENVASDNDNLLTNGNFASWPGDNPASWTVTGEVGNDPEISEAATGEGHASTPTPGGGMCNIYTSDGTSVSLLQAFTVVVGRKYLVSVNIDTVIGGAIQFIETEYSTWTPKTYSTTGIKTFAFVATQVDPQLQIRRSGATDITFDDVSVKEAVPIEDSSGNDHHGVAQQDPNLISVPGKTNTALAFNGSSDYIIVPDHADFTPVIAHSYSAWVKRASNDAFMGILSKGGNGGFGTFALLFADDNTITFVQSEAGAGWQTLINPATTVTDTNWHHLVGTNDFTTAYLYLDSVQIGVDSNPATSLWDIATDVSIGAEIKESDNAVGRFFDGTIDNAYFFNKILTAQDVRLLYMNGRGTEILNMRRWGWWW